MFFKRPAGIRIFSILIGFSLAVTVSAQSDDSELRSSFSEAYERYQAAFAASELEAAAAAAEEALELGTRLFGEFHQNTANLIQNHALMLELQGSFEEARTRYLAALDVLRELDVADSSAAIPVHIGLGGLAEDVGTQSEHFERALAIQRAAAPGDMLAYADLAVEIADILEASDAGRAFSVAMLGSVLDELEELHGEASAHLVPVLLALSRADFDNDSGPFVMLRSELGALPVRGESSADYVFRALAIERELAADDRLARAQLKVEIAESLIRSTLGSDIAVDILRSALDDLEDRYGNDSPELLPVLIALGKAEADIADDYRQLRWSQQAMDVAEDAFADDPLRLAELSLELGGYLLSMSRSPNSESFIEDAQDIYQEVLGADDERTATAAMSLGEVRFAKNNHRRAEPQLLAALDFFAGKEAFQGQEYRTRLMLSEIYERNDRSDEATPHLIELGRLALFAETQFRAPIYKVPPTYPPEAIAQGLEGYVVVQYKVLTTGRVADVEVIDSSDSVFDDVAMESARRYRYIPRFIDGEAVEEEGVFTRIEFVLR